MFTYGLYCWNIDHKYISSTTFAYSSGFKLCKGDFLEISDSSDYTIKNKIIYHKHIPMARVILIVKYLNIMLIISLENYQLGEYVDIDEFTH